MMSLVTCSRRSVLRVLALTLCLAGQLAAQTPRQAPEPQPLTVMSFNIRYGTANDGDNHWLRRREFLFDVVREQNADLIGVQEALASQIDEIVAAVPGYAVVGVGRDDGLAAGEFSAILFRTNRLRVAESGTFWFSDTPTVPGSRSWGNGITRISTWARFIDRDGRGFWHFNLHLDHQSQPSRVRSTELLAKRIADRPLAAEPVIVTGDFNVGEDNEAIHHLVGKPGGPAGAFVDTFRVLQRDAKEVGTFTGFKFGGTTGAKIDYVLVQPGTEVIEASIVRTSRDNRYPSDHFPVTAKIRLKPASGN
jgi:endonuclease/exonuclease/phosphatase family metal-dependent hydrolase